LCGGFACAHIYRLDDGCGAEGAGPDLPLLREQMVASNAPDTRRLPRQVCA
jgi:hypothetical protein